MIASLDRVRRASGAAIWMIKQQARLIAQLVYAFDCVRHKNLLQQSHTILAAMCFPKKLNYLNSLESNCIV